MEKSDEPELEIQIEIARHLGYLDEAGKGELGGQASEVGRMLNGMLEHFRQQPVMVPASRT